MRADAGHSLLLSKIMVQPTVFRFPPADHVAGHNQENPVFTSQLFRSALQHAATRLRPVPRDTLAQQEDRPRQHAIRHLRAAAQADSVAFAIHDQLSPGARRVSLQRFNLRHLVDQAQMNIAGGVSPSSDTVQTTLSTSSHLAQFIREQPGNSDMLLDLLLKTRKELRAELIAAQMPGPDAGNGADPPARQNVSPAMDESMSTVVDELQQTILAASPNRITPCRTSVTINGTVYSNPVRLGNGLWGEAVRYHNQAGQQPILVKSLMEQYALPYRHVMAEELRMHRQVMGHDGQGHPNIVGLKGIAVCDDGSLHAIMEEAKGGNLQNFAVALNMLGRTGIIPRPVRQIVTRAILRQAAMGLQAVQDAGAVHLDLKALNYLLDDDGIVKMSDFGSAQMLPEDGSTLPIVNMDNDVRVTRELAPVRETHITTKFDVFMFGEMLQGLTSDTLIEGELERGAGHVINTRTSHGSTALERLRNAALAPDPEQRPSVAGILHSAFISDDDGADPADIQVLIKRVAKYSNHMSSRVIEAVTRINIDDAQQSLIAGLEQELQRPAPRPIGPWFMADDQPTLETIEVRGILQAILAKLQHKRAENADQVRTDRLMIAQLHNTPGIQPLLQDVRAACSRLSTLG